MPEARIEEEGFGSVVYGAVFAWASPFRFGDFNGRRLVDLGRPGSRAYGARAGLHAGLWGPDNRTVKTSLIVRLSPAMKRVL